MPALAERTSELPQSRSRRRPGSMNKALQMESVSRALKQRDGELLVCDVSLYFQLYQELLQKSGGNKNLAKKYVFEAVKKDGVALIQENISALSNNHEPVFDLEYRARMQLTPTVNTYLLYEEETSDEQTGQKTLVKKMVSPEHAFIGRSVTEALTGWRRGNDAAVMAQNEALFANFDDVYDTEQTYVNFWGSPVAKESEGELVHKYNGEYGYIYAGVISHEAGKRKKVVYSFKNDLSSEQYEAFFNGLNGEKRMAEYKDREINPETKEVDDVMRTSVLIKGGINPDQIWKRLFEVKRESGEEAKMFGIEESTLLAVQDDELRTKLEEEASSEVASWLVSQMDLQVRPDVLQEQIKNQYIKAAQKTISKLKSERKVKKMFKDSADIADMGVSIVGEKKVNLADLARIKANEGKACGSWGGNSSVKIESSSQQLAKALSNYTVFKSQGWSGGGGGISLASNSEASSKCKDCQVRPVMEGGCGWCEPCGNKH